MTYRPQPIVCDKPATGHTSAVFSIAPGLADRPEMHNFHENGQQPAPDGRKIAAEEQLSTLPEHRSFLICIVLSLIWIDYHHHPGVVRCR